jgi:hypothetical protein
MPRTGPTPLKDLPQLLDAVGVTTLPDTDHGGSQPSLYVGSRRWLGNGGTCCARDTWRILIPHVDETGRRAANSPGEILARDVVVTPAMRAVQLRAADKRTPRVSDNCEALGS